MLRDRRCHRHSRTRDRPTAIRFRRLNTIQRVRFSLACSNIVAHTGGHPHRRNISNKSEPEMVKNGNRLTAIARVPASVLPYGGAKARPLWDLAAKRLRFFGRCAGIQTISSSSSFGFVVLRHVGQRHAGPCIFRVSILACGP